VRPGLGADGAGARAAGTVARYTESRNVFWINNLQPVSPLRGAHDGLDLQLSKPLIQNQFSAFMTASCTELHSIWVDARIGLPKLH